MKFKFIFFLYTLLCLGVFPLVSEAHYFEGGVRVGAYFPINRKIQCFYANGAPIYELRVAGHFGDPCQYIPWKVWGQLGYLPGNANYTRIKRTNLFPLSMGLEYGGALWGGEYTLGAGPVFVWMHFKDHLHGNIHHGHAKKGIGAVLKASYNWCRYGIIAGVFADFLILNMHYKRRHDGYNGGYNVGEDEYKYRRYKSHVPHHLGFNGIIVGLNLGTAF